MAYSWSMEKTFRLIEFYEENPCLYNTKEKQYHNRNLKSRVLVEILTALDVSSQSFILIILIIHLHLPRIVMCILLY